jgi:probable HAF family extracellular repeat protein
VGTFVDATGAHGFLGTGGVFTALDVPGANHTEAWGINTAGQIVGWFNDSTGTHGFLATPVNASPVCSAAQAFPSFLWSPNHQFVSVIVMGVTDPDGDLITITVTSVTQDEPVNAKGDGNTSPDAVIRAGAASVRAERAGTGNGRVYQISFRADDDKGGSCIGAVKVGVPHSMKVGSTAIDDGQVYDSTVP